MEVITKQQYLTGKLKEYIANKTATIERYRKQNLTVLPEMVRTLEALKALDLSTVTAEQLESILQPSWPIALKCDECGQASESLAVFSAPYTDSYGDPVDEDRSICAGCLRLAIKEMES